MKFDIKQAYSLAKKYKYVLAVVVLGLVLLVLPATGKKPPAKEADNTDFGVEQFEQRVKSVLSNMKGVGRVDVMLSVKSTETNVYAQESRTNTSKVSGQASVDQRQDVDSKISVVNGNQGEQTPVLISKNAPEFMGAVVVCDGADDPQICWSIIQAISSLTGAPSQNITVMKMKN